MENFISSANISSDFAFKYIPQKEFEKMVSRVRKDRERRGTWGSFCSVTSGNDEDDDEHSFGSRQKETRICKALADDDIQSIIKSIDSKDLSRRIQPVRAPFFGPARKLDVNSLRKEHENQHEQQQQRQKSPLETNDDDDSEETKTVHIVEEIVGEEEDANEKVQAQNQIDCDYASDCSSDNHSKESLEDDMLKLCGEIDDAIGGKMSSGDNSSVDLTYREEKAFQSIIDKNEEKVFCETYNKLIEEKFDFLNDDDDCQDDVEAAQTLPVVELREKVREKLPKNNDDKSNNNNVWDPKTENQIRKSAKHQESEKSKVSEKKKKRQVDAAFPSDVIIQKARHVEKITCGTNEKSQATEITPQTQPREAEKLVQSRVDMFAALGRNSQFQNKICQYLDYLREIIEDPPEIEDMNDLRKRQKRAGEFSNRFARNHLYQIGRISEEIRLMPDNPDDVATKANLLFQVVMQAVQTYLKNVEMFIYNNYPDKLLVLIDFIINASKICFDRMAADKRDLVMQRMLRKCSDIKTFLEQNTKSLAKFASIDENRKISLHSRSSFAYENGYETKLSMYEKPKTSKKGGGGKQFTKSPYDAPRNPYDTSTKPRNLKSSSSHLNSRSVSVMNRSKNFKQQQLPRAKTPIVKRSRSTVNTMVEQVKNNPSDGSIGSTSKPQREPLSVKEDESKERELMEMMKSIAQEKFQQLFEPILKSMLNHKTADDNLTRKKFNEQGNVMKIQPTYTNQPTPRRVTSDSQPSEVKARNPQVTKTEEKVSVAKNIQYLYVKSDDDNYKGDDNATTTSKTHLAINKNNRNSCNDLSKANKMKVANTKPPAGEATKSDAKLMKEMKEQALKDRMAYVEQMMENPLYMNEACSEPWKMFARISDQLVDEMLQNIVGELDFGEKGFVENFLCHELEF